MSPDESIAWLTTLELLAAGLGSDADGRNGRRRSQEPARRPADGATDGAKHDEPPKVETPVARARVRR